MSGTVLVLIAIFSPELENSEITPGETPSLPVVSELSVAEENTPNRGFLAAIGLAPFNFFQLLLVVVLLAGAGLTFSDRSAKLWPVSENFNSAQCAPRAAHFAF